jgi:hypothetical protein
VCGGRPLLTEVVIVYQKDRLTSTGDDIRCHGEYEKDGRVKTARMISSRGPGTRRRDALEAEGVEVTTRRMGESRIDLSKWGWFPQRVQIEQHAEG